jgi:hypothetical protein
MKMSQSPQEGSPLLAHFEKTAKSRTRFTLSVIAGGVLLMIFILSVFVRKPANKLARIAFIGNSMMYYNDLPRLLEELSEGRIRQNSCLHGSTGAPTLYQVLINGNGMFQKFDTANSLLEDTYMGTPIYDFGACTVPQLLFGRDVQLSDQMHDKDGTYRYLFDDGSNPCLQEPDYFEYLESKATDEAGHQKLLPQWDFVVMNDYTANPGRNRTRQASLQLLRDVYLPLIQQLKTATPVFLDTHAYWTAEHKNLAGLANSIEEMPRFTSLTYEGYRQYAQMMADHLPEQSKPRIAPVGIAFLVVWEEDRKLWHSLFHSDRLHPSPAGTFLSACIVHATVFGKMPRRDWVVRDDMDSLWCRARVLQPADMPPNPFPTKEQAEYLHEVAQRVTAGYRPSSFIE